MRGVAPAAARARIIIGTRRKQPTPPTPPAPKAGVRGARGEGSFTVITIIYLQA